jgi:hypothetical protein
MILTGDSRSTRRKTSPTDMLPATNPTRTGLGLNVEGPGNSRPESCHSLRVSENRKRAARTFFLIYFKIK